MKLITAKLLLGPLFFFQAFRLRKKIVILPDPEGAIKGSNGVGEDLNLLIVGDSGAMGVGVQNQSLSLKGRLVDRLQTTHKVNYHIMAKTGSTSKKTRQHLLNTNPRQFDIALISLGINDITSGTTNLNFKKVQKEIITILRDKFGVKQIILSGLPPIGKFPVLPQPSRWFIGKTAEVFDQSLRDMAKSENCGYIKSIDSNDTSLLADDGFHPGPQIYDYWAEQAYKAISL